MSFQALVEKSHTIETETVVYVMRRDEGVPPYRRLRRESDTMSFRASAKKFPCGKNGTLHIRASPLARSGSLPLRCGGSPFLFPHGGGSRRKPRFESVVKRGGVAVTDDFGNLFDRIIGTAEQSRGVIEFRVAHDVGKSFSE